MVDEESRARFASALRRLATGRITNDEFERAVFGLRGTDDPALDPAARAAWLLYSDLYEHRLRGEHALSPSGRRFVARVLLFLRSGLPYEWPELSTWLWRLLVPVNLLTLGTVGRVVEEWWRGQRGPAARLLDAFVAEPLHLAVARSAGRALACVRRGPSVVDAIVMASAALRGDRVLTGGVADLERLRAVFPEVRLLAV